MTATSFGVDQAVVNMMDAVFADYRLTHPPSDIAERDVQLWRALDDLWLIRLTGAEGSGGSGAGWFDAAACAEALQTACGLALAAGSAVDAARWESEAAYLTQIGGQAAGAPTAPATGWLASVAMAGAAIWEGCGVACDGRELSAEPAWPGAGSWWALLGLPLANGKHLSLLWDGATLHATQPVRSSLPVALWKRIQIHHTDEFDFDPVFELTPDPQTSDTAKQPPAAQPQAGQQPAVQQSVQRFKPKFVAG